MYTKFSLTIIILNLYQADFVSIKNHFLQIVHYDSMVCSPSIMENRCRVHQRLIRDFRIYIRYNWEWNLKINTVWLWQ